MELSSCEVEFIATAMTLCQAWWLRKLLSKVTRSELKLVTLYIDKKYAIALMKNLVFHGRNKHIKTCFHFIRECVKNRKIIVQFVCTREQRANIRTKALTRVKFAKMLKVLRMKDLKQNQVYEGDCELINSMW